MVFSSYEFLLVFLPITLLGYFLLSHIANGIWQKLFLLGASMFFYGYYNIGYLLLILASMLANYLIALAIHRQPDKNAARRKAMLILGVLVNIGLIGYFKYFDFFLATINEMIGTGFVLQQILLPLGISFFTFQQLSFLISVYKREEDVDSLMDYCIFVTFFPQLVAGPIVLYTEMIPQFADEKKRYFNADNFASGLYYLAVGLFKKAVIADTLVVVADNGFGLNEMGLIGGWVTAFSYTLQIYFDFSGYSDMAIGLGKLFNIELPDNFDRPYLSESITAFWRRWHMTLGRALSTYVYKPLGGNRSGMARTCVNLFLTFFVSGLWHGAAWTFVAWGAVQGLIVVLERISRNMLCRIPHAIRVTCTFLTTIFLWVLFRADSFEGAFRVYRAMFNFCDLGYSDLSVLALDGTVAFPSVLNGACIFLMIGVLLAVIFRGAERIERNQKKFFCPKQAILAAISFALSLLCMGRESVFIYFNF